MGAKPGANVLLDPDAISVESLRLGDALRQGRRSARRTPTVHSPEIPTLALGLKSMTDDALARGLKAFEESSWQRAYAELGAADEAGSLGIDDLERFALAAYVLGKEYDCARLWTRAHRECVRQNDPQRAARCAFWQACGLLFKGEMAPAMGWIARGRRILDDFEPECSEKAWLLVLTGIPMMFRGDPVTALPYFVEADEIASRFGDPDVQTFARLTRGHSLILMNEPSKGLALFDEVMVAVTSGELNPLLAGIAYCQVIATCHEIFDWRRAREWTAALSRWCDSQPDSRSLPRKLLSASLRDS